jgi:hypothetical protein
MTSMPALAFFPWVSIDEPLTVGPVRLLPYDRGKLPGDQPHATQADIDGVLAAYAVQKNQLVFEATLMEIGDWRLGQEIDDGVREQLFRARELLAFSALASRRLFRGHMDYCNFDTYAFFVQGYVPTKTRHFSFFTRRRDGGTQQLWSTSEFAFLKPLHVASRAKAQFDSALLAALLAADAADKLPYEAIVEFNRANTDSYDVPVHTELVMTKSAFEFLLDINHEANKFVQALLPLVPDCTHPATRTGALSGQWQSSRSGKPIRPLEAWVREFCIRRNEGAHGARRRGGNRLVWSEQAHLAFASLLFPLVVKQGLAKDGFLSMDERDVIELERIEAYLMHDPFAPVDDDQGGPRVHPWGEVYNEIVSHEMLRRTIERQMENRE